MKTKFCSAGLALLALFSTSTSHAALDLIAEYAISFPSPLAATTTAPGITARDITEKGVFENSSASGFNGSAYLFAATDLTTSMSEAMSQNDYLEFTITPNFTFELDLASLTFDTAGSGGNWALFSSH